MKHILSTIICILNGLIMGRAFVKKEWFLFVAAIASFVAFLAYEYFVGKGIKNATEEET